MLGGSTAAAASATAAAAAAVVAASGTWLFQLGSMYSRLEVDLVAKLMAPRSSGGSAKQRLLVCRP